MRVSYRFIRSEGLRFLSDARLRDHPALPFVGLEVALQFFDLPPGPAVSVDISDIVLPTASPAFKNLEADTLLILRKCLYAGKHLDLAARWAEGLMRFCEVRLSSLESRARQKWGTISAARLQLLEVGVFLLDAYFVQRDLRFLNTALKLTDQKWLFPPQPLLAFWPQPRLAAVWQWRMSLMITYLLAEIGAHHDG
ncbi:MAG: hypothetical protein N2049_04010 [Anaerolineales bacterium]|nr:hypothetical protein [Anaerolineales bacterium]